AHVSRDPPTPVVRPLSLHAALPILRFRSMAVLDVAPLCPAGHLPHKGGDRPSSCSPPVLHSRRLAKAGATANLPPCGGDVRQDRSEEHTSELQSRENLVCRLQVE